MSQNLIQLQQVSLADANDVQYIYDDINVYNNTLTIPEPPLAEGWALTWIQHQLKAKDEGQLQAFVIKSVSDNQTVGFISLFNISEVNNNAELGYAIAKDHRRKGYAEAAVREVLKYGFEQLDLSRIYAFHFGTNIGSGALLEKVGFIHEGCMRAHICKNGVMQNSQMWGLLKSEYQAN